MTVTVSNLYHPVSMCGVSNSKLTIFTGMGSISWDFIKGSSPRVLKILDAFGDNVVNVKKYSPDTVIVGAYTWTVNLWTETQLNAHKNGGIL